MVIRRAAAPVVRGRSFFIELCGFKNHGDAYVQLVIYRSSSSAIGDVILQFLVSAFHSSKVYGIAWQLCFKGVFGVRGGASIPNWAKN